MKISRNEIKFIRQLHQKKYRDEQGIFVVQGEKLVLECLHNSEGFEYLVAKEEWLLDRKRFYNDLKIPQIRSAATTDMEQISTLTNSPDVILVMKKLKSKLEVEPDKNEFILLLDGIQDPGNLGTILRLADWFGITHVFCSAGTVELYNPKVIQATMGAFLRINVAYIEADWIKKMKQRGFIFYGADLIGTSIYEMEFKGGSVLVLGNEAHGISLGMESLLDKKITIPSFGERNTSESLNVAMATAVICGEVRRQMMNYSK